MNKFLVLITGILCCIPSYAVTYTREDSLRVVRLLEQGKQKATAPLHLWYAHQLVGTPYVAATLEINKTEELIVNLRQLDCTTFVETAVALAMTTRQGSTRFDDYCRNLEKIRYRNGRLNGYASRNHYFTQWISSNEQLGIVSERQSSQPPFTAVQTIDLHYMSLHPQLYPMLKNDKEAQALIRKFEQQEQGRKFRYIPHNQLNQQRQSPLGIIRDGDILAIVTKKDGLDTSHIGFAQWDSKGQLHLLNASQIHKRVILEPMTLYQYMGKHPTQLGVRVISVIGD